MTETQRTQRSAGDQGLRLEAGRSAGSFRFCAILFLVFAAWLVWYTAGHWDRWTGAARYEIDRRRLHVRRRDAARGEGVRLHHRRSPVNDYQIVRKGDLLVGDRPFRLSRPSSTQAEANLAAAEADARQSRQSEGSSSDRLIQQAEATIDATEADVAALSARGQAPARPLEDRDRRHAAVGRAGRRQREAHRCAMAAERGATRSAEGRCWRALDVQEKQLKAQIKARRSAGRRWRATICSYTRILSPADGLVGQRQVRPASSSMSARR